MSALTDAKEPVTILRELARACWAKANDDAECPERRIPEPVELAEWAETPAAEPALAECRKLDRKRPLLPGDPPYQLAIWYRYRMVPGALVVARAQPGDLVMEYERSIDSPFGRTNKGRQALTATIVDVHEVWTHAEHRRHPLAPLVDAWQRWKEAQPVDAVAGKVTVTGGSKRGMTRRVQIVSTVRRVGWAPDDGRPGAIVDGESVAAALPDSADLFPVKERRPRRVFKPGEQRPLAFPPMPSILADLRLLALHEVSADPNSSSVLLGDLLYLLTFAHLADAPVNLTQHQGTALLVRNRDGLSRAVQPQHDYRRFWEAAYWLRTLVVWEPNGGYRWADLATVEVPTVKPVTRLTIGPPAWARGGNVGKWTLTAEGSAASLKRATAGKQSLAGRLVTGLEYRLAAGWSGKPNTVAPHLRPAHPRRGASPGPVVFVGWREAMFGAGNWWDVTDSKADKAALVRFNRADETLEKRGYFVGDDLRCEAPAGDSVEIVDRIRGGGRGRPGGLLVRASARFVEAARLAQLPRGRGFEPMLLTDYTGIEGQR